MSDMHSNHHQINKISQFFKHNDDDSITQSQFTKIEPVIEANKCTLKLFVDQGPYGRNICQRVQEIEESKEYHCDSERSRDQEEKHPDKYIPKDENYGQHFLFNQVDKIFPYCEIAGNSNLKDGSNFI